MSERGGPRRPEAPTVRAAEGSQVCRTDRPHARHDRRLPRAVSGSLSVTFRLAEALHVGSGFKRRRGRGIIEEMVRCREAPVVPGSTWKGAVRSRYEAITRSCLSRDCRAGRPPGLCPACALFGCLGLRSRLGFEDALAPEDVRLDTRRLPETPSPRKARPGTRMFPAGRQSVGDGKVKVVETLPAGTELGLDISILNATPAEMGGLLAALGAYAPLAFKIGAGKTYGLGRLSVESVRLDPGGELDSALLDEAVWSREFEAAEDFWKPGYQDLMALDQWRSPR